MIIDISKKKPLYYKTRALSVSFILQLNKYNLVQVVDIFSEKLLGMLQP